MTSREALPLIGPGFGEEPDEREGCAPIRETAAAELDGLFRFAVAQLGARSHMASDVVQQALVIALGHASPPPVATVQRSWLRGIVRNVIRHEMRSLRRARGALERATFARDPHRPADPSGDVCAADDGRERMVRALFVAVAELDGADQDLFYAFYRSGRSHACIAAELGTTVKAVEARLYRLRARLRAMEPFPVSVS